MSDMQKIEEKYNEILGNTQDTEMTFESQPAKETQSQDSKPKKLVDSAYQQPSYDGQEPKTEAELNGEVEDTEEDIPEEADQQEEVEETEEIPQHLIDAGRAMGLSDDMIINLAENNEEVLVKIANNLIRKQEPQIDKPVQKEPVGDDKKEQKETKLAAIDIDYGQLGLDPEAESVFKKMQEGFNKMVEHVNAVNEKLGQSEQVLSGITQRQQLETQKTIINYYDEIGNEHQEFGNSKKGLTPEQYANRDFAQKVAYAQQQAFGLSDEEALQIGISALLGRVSKTKINERIVSGLAKRKSQSSIRPDMRKKTESQASPTERFNQEFDRIIGGA